jgi:hypothetical protein
MSVPEKPDCFRQHMSSVRPVSRTGPELSDAASVHPGDGPQWLGASGVRGLSQLTITLATEPVPERCYTVRLHFLEPDAIGSGQRVFDVALQGEIVLPNFDVCTVAGGVNRRAIREFRGVKVTRDLTVTLTPTDCAGAGQPVLSGVEIVAEGW